MTDNNKVTIDADYFYELFRKANETDGICKECREEHTAEEFKALRRERDELKARLADCEKRVLNKAGETSAGSVVVIESYKERLAAAERCIDDIDTFWHKWNIGVPFEDGENFFQRVYNTIRAYRAAKEAK